MDHRHPHSPPHSHSLHAALPDVAAAATGGGLLRWFPTGFATEHIDWIAFEECFSMVPDLAHEIITVEAPRPFCASSNYSTMEAAGDHDHIMDHHSNLCNGHHNFGKDNIVMADGDHDEHDNPNPHQARGVHALHLAVSCGNPPAPLSVIQRLVDINPDALDKTEETSGMNVLHCALQFHPHLRDTKEDNNNQHDADHNSSNDHDHQSISSTPSRDCHQTIDQAIRVTQLLLRAKVELARQMTSPVATTTMNTGDSNVTEEVGGGLPPLAYAPCKEVVPLLVKVMPLSMVTGLLHKIFQQRQLLTSATNVESMEQVVREVWVVQHQQERSILSHAILPGKVSRKQSVIEYTLYQALRTKKGTPERSDLFRLAQSVLQATYSFYFHINSARNDERTLFTSTPPAWDCLEELVGKHKIKKKALDLYEQLQQEDKMSVQVQEEEEEPASGFSQAAFIIDPSRIINDHNSDSGLTHEGFIQEEKKQDHEYQQQRPRRRRDNDDTGIEEVVLDEGENDFRHASATASTASSGLNELLRRKEQLNAKIEQSFDAVRRATTALERYQTTHNETVDRLLRQMDVPSPPTVSTVPDPSFYVDTTPTSSGSRKRHPAEQSVLHSTTNQTHKRTDNKEENSSSVRAVVALSSLTPIPAPLPSIPRAASMPMSGSASGEPSSAPQRRRSATSTPASFPSSNAARDIDDFGTNNPGAPELNINDAIEEVKCASQVIDQLNSVFGLQAELLEQQIENRTKFCMSFFRTAEQREAANAGHEIRCSLAQKETLKQRISVVKERLKETRAQGDSHSALGLEQRASLAQLNNELLTLEGKIAYNREIVTRRRQEVGNRIFEARKFSKQLCEQRDRRTRRSMLRGLNDFLCEAKKEMKVLLANLCDVPRPNNASHRSRRKARLLKEIDDLVDDELTQLAKRLKLK